MLLENENAVICVVRVKGLESGDPEMVDMFTMIGAGQWFRYAIGALRLPCG